MVIAFIQFDFAYTAYNDQIIRYISNIELQLMRAFDDNFSITDYSIKFPSICTDGELKCEGSESKMGLANFSIEEINKKVREHLNTCSLVVAVNEISKNIVEKFYKSEEANFEVQVLS